MIDQCQCCGSEIRKYRGTFVSGPNYAISQDKKTATKCNNTKWDCNAILSDSISPGTITIIKFRIEKTDSNSHIMIGIAPKVNNQNMENFFFSYGYFMNCYNGCIYNHHPFQYDSEKFLTEKRFPEGTIITMIVDTNAGKLSYRINEGFIKTAFHSITFVDQVYPYVLFMTKGDAIKIIHE